MSADAPRSFEPDRLGGDLRREDADAPVEGATWYRTASTEGALVYDLPDGALVDAAYLTFDVLVDGEHELLFHLGLHEGGPDARAFRLQYGLLCQCEARVRVPLRATEQERWMYDREGAWLKPVVGGDRVDPARVARVEVAVVDAGPGPSRWCQTPLEATAGTPPRLTDPVLPGGPLLDEFGQSTIHEWAGRTESEAELVERLRGQRRRAGERALPGAVDGEELDEWGGWTGLTFEATGFFRTEHDGNRWWLVTPDGHPFWSTGLDCVRPNLHTRYDGLADALAWLPDEGGEFADAHEDWTGWSTGEFFNYQKANLIRAFGADEWEDAWVELALGQLRRFGFNTVGNWSDREMAGEAGVPYVRALRLEFPDDLLVFRDFPDVFREDFPDAAAEVTRQLEETVGDPAMIGYFLGNEPRWNFAEELPAVGMLHDAESCATRRELADWLAERYGDDAGLAAAWGTDVALDEVESGS